jgi:hypothetical protein
MMLWNPFMIFFFCPSARRMYNAVFQILQNSGSLELAAASFHLLLELGKVKCCCCTTPFIFVSPQTCKC